MIAHGFFDVPGGPLTTTLLAVDDSKTMRKVLEITFAGEDYKVVLAENSQQALELLRSERPSVALVDAALGSESGYELCRSIKNESPGTGVIILSSKHAPYDKGRGSSAGADDFMDKPFDTQQLLDKTGGVARKAVEAPVAPPKPAPSPIAPVVAPPVSAPASMARTQAYGGAPAAPKPVAPAPAARPPVTAPAPAAPAARPAAAPVPVAAAAATSGNGALAGKLADMGLSPQQVEGVLALSREVVEQVVWEVVPQLAETIIQEEIRRLTAE
jgi:CheY-like chemotaxis protein